MSLTKLSENKCFGGTQLKYRHQASTTKCDMTFSIFLPPQASDTDVPVLYWLSGLTCTDDNFVTKAGAQQYAAAHGIAIVCPDTSPRGEDVPDDADGAYDFGLGAGFYVNATQSPWAEHYRMYDYVVNELPELIKANFPVNTKKAAISGHSMGGHGAITIGLKNPNQYKSISAFAPICAPTRCPWGQKALTGYLGTDEHLWQEYDSSMLIADSDTKLPLMVDQGDADNFLVEQLKPELLDQACEANNYPLTLRFQKGYDHSYFFIASFIEEHIAFHAKHIT